MASYRQVLPTASPLPFEMEKQKEKSGAGGCRRDLRRSTLPNSFGSSMVVSAQKAATAAQMVLPSTKKVIRSLSMPNVAPTMSSESMSKNTFTKAFMRHRIQLPVWFLLVGSIYAVYHLFSDGDFSFLFTLSSIVSTFSFGFLFLKVTSTGSDGISVKMLHCFQLVLAARLSSILFFNGYLPYDASGNIIYRVSECAGFLICSLIYVIVYNQQRPSATDTQSKESAQLRIFTIVSLIMAACFHLTLNKFLLTDMAWAFALYLETVAVLPQLILFFREKKVEPAITHFMFAQACAKLMAFTFWMTIYDQLNPFGFSFVPGLAQYVGYFVVVMQVVQLLVMGDFVVAYLRAICMGIPLDQILNVSENV
eukprot:Filipodium_phascolosomae@DN539_c0_g1_i1.p1